MSTNRFQNALGSSVCKLKPLHFPKLYTLGLLCNVGLVFIAALAGYVAFGYATEFEKSLHAPKLISEADVKLLIKQYNDCKAERIWEMTLRNNTGIQYRVSCSEDLRFSK